MGDYYTNTSEYSPVGARMRQAHSDIPMEHPMENPVAYPMAGPVPASGLQAPVPQHKQNVLKNMKMYSETWNYDLRDIFKRALKYLFEGLAVAFVAYYFTKSKLDFKEIALLGITAAFVFAILDTFSPTISLGARFGAGFGIGQTMFGVNPVMMMPAAV